MTSAVAKAKQEMESARAEVVECEREIQTIKGALRELAASNSGDDAESPNSLEISALKVQGLPDTAKPAFVLQLSSPVEELTLTKMLDKEEESTTAESESSASSSDSKAIFQGVEMSVATLTVSAKDMDIPLGISATHDLSTLFSSGEEKKSTYVNVLEVAIVPEDGGGDDTTPPAQVVKEEAEEKSETETTTEKVEEEEEGFQDALEEVTATPAKAPKEEGEEETKEEKDTDKKAPAIVSPICTVTLRLTFKPSAKDKKEELYEELNKASQRKGQAIDRLRKNATAVSRAAPPPSAAGADKNPAVKSGFLNKKTTETAAAAKPNPIVAFYEKVLGPQSLVRAIFPVVKNYIIFFGCAAFIQFKGHMLALPPPV